MTGPVFLVALVGLLTALALASRKLSRTGATPKRMLVHATIWAVVIGAVAVLTIRGGA